MRLIRGHTDKDVVAAYVSKARVRIVHQTAARAWSLGVPWATALKAAERAVAAGDAVANPIAKRKGKGKGKGKAQR